MIFSYKKLLIFVYMILLVLISTHFFPKKVYANESFISYKVLPNDTLSKILKNHSLTPIYGENGYLSRTLKLNPEKEKSQGDFIFTGETILLPKKDVFEKKFITKTIINNKKILKNDTHDKLIKKNEPKKIDSFINLNNTKTNNTPLEIKIINNNYLLNSNNELLFQNSTKIPPLNLQYKFINLKNSDIINQNTNSVQKLFIYSEENSELNIDYNNSCDLFPKCRPRLWDLELTCCNPDKSFLLKFEQKSI